jgi:DNA polymerase-3 subunit alpha
MKELKPSNIEDVIAGISLYRPGPMDFIPDYVRGKENPDAVVYLHPALEKILAQTYGCIVYQEQVMQIVMELAGYSLGRSDLVRRAMSKKKADVMEEERYNFVYGNEEMGVPGCINRGVSENVANEIFDEMTDFAHYAFNKSHAAAYAVVTFQTAYLKCHYPVEYMAALISSVSGNNKKISNYIQSCKGLGIKVLPPDINKGRGDFTVAGYAIRYGLSAIKSVGDGVTEVIRQEVLKNGEFKSLEDFIKRLSNKEANKRTIESFIKAGAMDSFGYNRKQLLMVYEEVISQVSRQKKNEISGQMSIMDFLAPEERAAFEVQYPDVQEFSKEEQLAQEKEMLGVYISGHPLDDYMDIIDLKADINSSDFQIDEPEMDENIDAGEEDEIEHISQLQNTPRVQDKQEYTIVGMIEAVTVKTTKRGDTMAFVTLEDLYGTMELIVFPREYSRYRDKLVKNAKILVTGKASVSERDAKLILSTLETLDEVRLGMEDEGKVLWLCFINRSAYMEGESELRGLLKQVPGKTDVNIQLKVENKGKYMGPGFRVDSKKAEQLLAKRYGEKNVLVLEKKK